MEDMFTALDDLHLQEHGDARERHVWRNVATALPNYEEFWRTLIVLLTNRIDPSIPFGSVWTRLRSTIPQAYEQLAMHNYSLFYYAAVARQSIDGDRRRLASGDYPHPERVFFALQACIENAKHLQYIARDILRGLLIAPELPRHPGHLYKEIGAYRNAFTHDPVLGRAVDHGRELLPSPELLPRRGRPLLWRDVAAIPSGHMIDCIECEDRCWQGLTTFFQTQWAALTDVFVQARQYPKFLADLGLAAFLPIRLISNTASLAGPSAASGTIIARSDIS